MCGEDEDDTRLYETLSCKDVCVCVCMYMNMYFYWQWLWNEMMLSFNP